MTRRRSRAIPIAASSSAQFNTYGPSNCSLVSANGPSMTIPSPGPRKVRARRRAQPRRRPEQLLRVEPVMHRQQFGHQGRVLLRRPGPNLGFDVIGQHGVEHRLSPLSVRRRTGFLPRTIRPGLSRQMEAPTKQSGNTIYRMALERHPKVSTDEQNANQGAPFEGRSCDASQPRSSAMPPDGVRRRRRREQAVGTTSPGHHARSSAVNGGERIVEDRRGPRRPLRQSRRFLIDAGGHCRSITARSAPVRRAPRRNLAGSPLASFPGSRLPSSGEIAIPLVQVMVDVDPFNSGDSAAMRDAASIADGGASAEPDP